MSCPAGIQGAPVEASVLTRKHLLLFLATAAVCSVARISQYRCYCVDSGALQPAAGAGDF